VTVIAPSRMERTPGLQVKTDRLDAGKMVRKLEQGELKGIYVPVRGGHEKRQVARTYGQALKERQRAQQRMRSLMQEHGRLGPLPTAGWTLYRQLLDTQEWAEEVTLCVDALLAMRTAAERQAKMLKARMLRLAASAAYRRIVAALCTHPGVAHLSAIRFVLEIGAVHRFATADSIGHYLMATITPTHNAICLIAFRSFFKRGSDV
jgi:transposase